MEIQMEIINFIQSIHNPVLDALFLALTSMGSEAFFFIVIPAIYWGKDKKAGLGLGVSVLLSMYINVLLKEIVKIKRPFDYPSIRTLPRATAGGYSFPSGHAQSTASLWGYLMGYFGRPWLYWTSLAAILLVSLSRLYLGVHWPADVAGGAAIGMIVAYAGLAFTERVNHLRLHNYPAKIAASVLIPIVLLILFPHHDNFKYMPMLAGILIGFFTDEDFIGYQPKPNTFNKNILKYFIGIAVFLPLYFGLRAVLPYGNIGYAVRYFLSGLWFTLGAPWIFKKCNL